MAKVTLYMKHDDRIQFQFEDGDSYREIHSDYMPRVGILGGDDTTLRIDNETGKIIGWIPINIDELPETED